MVKSAKQKKRLIDTLTNHGHVIGPMSLWPNTNYISLTAIKFLHLAQFCAPHLEVALSRALGTIKSAPF